jgi:hypothetical protein
LTFFFPVPILIFFAPCAVSSPVSRENGKMFKCDTLCQFDLGFTSEVGKSNSRRPTAARQKVSGKISNRGRSAE